MHYFQNMSSAFGGFAPDSHPGSMDPAGGIPSPGSLTCATSGKIPAGAHEG